MMSRTAYRVLILDADLVPALTVARSLAKKGCRVEVASHVERPIGGYSRVVSAVHRYPDPLTSADDFVDWVIACTRESQYDLVIPVTERTLVPLGGRRGELAGVRVAMAAEESLDLVLDKSRTMELAQQLGVPVPSGVKVSNLDELAGQHDTMCYPIVLKPARSIGSRDGGASHLQVSYAFDAIGLVTGCTHALRFGPVVLQEYFSGDGVGIELIAKEGEILYAFQHRRLHEVPLTGGGSSLRVSEPVNESLLEASERLIRALRWHGVAMVEFKVDRDSGEFCLMEINGRFWGSLPLAVAAGADFPAMLLELELEGDVGARAPYRNQVYCRLLSRDLMWYEAALRGAGDNRLVALPSRRENLRHLALFLHPYHRMDVQSLLDPRPGLVDIGRILRNYHGRLHSLLEQRRFLARQRRAWRRGEVAAKLAQADSVLFICYGNINRSALADVMVRAYAQDAGVEVCSAGFHSEENRPADPVMVEIAAGSGVDLEASRSRLVSRAMLDDSDIIFVMEKTHYDRLLSMDPGLVDKVFLLGAHPAETVYGAEIDDPFGMSREAYLACYERITQAIDHIKGVIALRNIY
jgi:protein-tyrosine-phosphatase/predicted ATP-grasp superfamily ATP-dependent carboligase